MPNTKYSKKNTNIMIAITLTIQIALFFIL